MLTSSRFYSETVEAHAVVLGVWLVMQSLGRKRDEPQRTSAWADRVNHAGFFASCRLFITGSVTAKIEGILLMTPLKLNVFRLASL